MAKKTKNDAIAQVNRARVGSLAGHVTDEYLNQLTHELYGWLQEIEERKWEDSCFCEECGELIDNAKDGCLSCKEVA